MLDPGGLRLDLGHDVLTFWCLTAQVVRIRNPAVGPGAFFVAGVACFVIFSKGILNSGRFSMIKSIPRGLQGIA